MKLKIISALLVLLSFPATKGYTQNISAFLDSFCVGRNGMADHPKTFTGAGMGIIWKGKAYARSFGNKNLENKTKVDDNTVFEIGSVTKTFTSLLLAKEMLKGTIDTNTTIDKFVKVNEKLRNKIKVIDLARHTSGLPTLHDSATFAALDKVSPNQPYAIMDTTFLLNMLHATKTLTNYGKYEYSNFGYAILGYILCKINHKTYEKLLDDEIFTPLRMNNSNCLLDTNNQDWAHGYDGGLPQSYMILAGAGPAGNIKSTVGDMLRYVRCQMHPAGTPLEKAVLLTHKIIYHDDQTEIGMGWFRVDINGHKIYFMQGDTHGFSSAAGFDESGELGFVILLNSSAHNGTGGFISSLVDEVYPEKK